MDDKQKRIAFQWRLVRAYSAEVDDGSGTQTDATDKMFALNPASSASQKLTIDADSLTPYFFYYFELKGYSVYKPSLHGLAYVTIKCNPTTMIPKIVGGEGITASKRKSDRLYDETKIGFPIDASLSEDPDDRTDATGYKTFKWSCSVITATTVAERTCRDKDGNMQFFKSVAGVPHPSTIVTTIVDLNEVQTTWFDAKKDSKVYITFETNGTYQLVVNATKSTNWGNGQRTKSAQESINVEVTFEDLPEVIIQPLVRAKYNPTSQVTMEAFIESNIMPTYYSWSEETGTFSEFATSDAIVKPRAGSINVNSAADMAIVPNCIYNELTKEYDCTLKPAQTLVFKLSAWTEKSLLQGNIAYGKISVTVNEPPSGGQLTISPSSGVQLETEFSLEMTNWNDDDVPLVYSFFYFEEKRGVQRRKYLLSDSPTPTSDQFLPKGDENNDYKLTIVGMVKDKYAAAAVAVGEVIVGKMQIADGDVTNQLSDFVNSQISDMSSSGNSDAVKSTMLSVTQLLNDVPLKSTAATADADTASADQQPTDATNSLLSKIRKVNLLDSSEQASRMALRDSMMGYAANAIVGTPTQNADGMSQNAVVVSGIIKSPDQTTAGSYNTAVNLMTSLYEQADGFTDAVTREAVMDMYECTDYIAQGTDMGKQVELESESTEGTS